ncbi:hypothetical protein [Ilumatobacter coccineus]|uniref:Uncharacterized protein n=1 Tax=Ilumatobacter coccineus (strain NBRC 103263 / KCTC 29153 / YM16-304) TaxID=1313172 RepID=A0A6C7E831_ILUCY|nr:hypothetical protein [Ilumatobacter coccineus]BAN01359.1 hypothetical protein YM304_10450 [Ilumatobacter coccineus YM16-304]
MIAISRNLGSGQRAAVFVAAAALALAATACGGSSGDDGSSPGAEANAPAVASIDDVAICLADTGFEVTREADQDPALVLPDEYKESVGLVESVSLGSVGDAKGIGSVAFYDDEDAAETDFEAGAGFRSDDVQAGTIGATTWDYIVTAGDDPGVANSIERCLGSTPVTSDADAVSSDDDGGDANGDGGEVVDAAGLDELPELLAAFEDAMLDEGDPLPVARRLGFPYEIEPPTGSVLRDIEVGFSNQTGTGTGGPTDFFYFSVVAPGGTIPPIDAEADDNGPGAAHVADVFGDALGELGYERADESYANGPREAGGPSSVTWYFRRAGAGDEVSVRGVEDLTRAFDDDRPDDMVAGYSINVSRSTDAPGTTSVAFFSDLIELVPLPPGAALDKGSLRTTVRDADSTQLDLGRVEFGIQLDWVTPDLTGDDLVDFYSTATFTDGRLIAAERTSADSDTYAPSEMMPLGDDHRLPVLLSSSYGGVVTTRPAEDDEPARIHLDISLSPVDIELRPADAEN